MSNNTHAELSKDDERGKWDRKAESILSMLGFCVGTGNLWRFPYLVMRNGGGAFLVPFLFFLIVSGLPLYFLEVSLGQYSGRGIIKIWDICPLFRGIGVGICILSTISCIYFIVIMCWSLYYIVSSFIAPVPWSLCGQNWNSPVCVSDRKLEMNESLIEDSSLSNSSMMDINGVGYRTFETSKYNISVLSNDYSSVANSVISNTTKDAVKVVTSEEEFWQNRVLNLSSGIHQIGDIQWHLLACFFVSWVMVYLCIFKGPKSVGKAVYVTVTLPYILLTIILIRGLTLPGSLDGIIFYIYPEFGKIMRIEVWIEAAIQVFYSAGIVWGCLITMASFNKFNNNCLRDSVCLILAGEGSSIYGGFVIFSVIGYMSYKTNIPVPEVVKSGPGLGFVAYPEALSLLPLTNLWAVLFFIMLLSLAIDSTFGTIEPVFTAVTDSFSILRRNRALFIGVASFFCFLIGIPMCTEGGMYIFQLVDWYSASIANAVFGTVECLVIGWIYGANKFSRDVEMMIGRGVPLIFKVCWCFVTPITLLLLLGSTLLRYKPPEYGEYQYPKLAQMFGWFIAILPLLPVPVVGYMELRKAEGLTFIEKLQSSLRPNKLWGPNIRKEEGTLSNGRKSNEC